MSETFNFGRFCLLVRWDILSRWKGIVNTTIAFAIVLAFLYITIVGERTGITSVIFAAYMIVGAGMIFSNMKTKQQRIAFLTVPASRLEKYVSRLLDVTVVNILIYMVAMVIADVAQMALSSIIYHGYAESVSIATIGNMFQGEFVLTSALFIVWFHSSYVLGGAFFRRNQIILTTCVHLVVGMVLMTLLMSALRDMLFGMYTVDDPYSYEEALRKVETLLDWLFVAAAVFDYWAAYKIFGRMQVINNKWTNLA